eukprot:scaffold277487_cov12-Tisochrysis_lutea.AAC.1
MSAAPHWAPPGRRSNRQRPSKHSNNSSIDIDEEVSVGSYTSSFDAAALEQGEPQRRSDGKIKANGRSEEGQDEQEGGEQQQQHHHHHHYHLGSSSNNDEDAE